MLNWFDFQRKEKMNAIQLVREQFLRELDSRQDHDKSNIVEGWFSNSIVFDFLIHELRPSSVIEVGTFTGNSACYMHDRLSRYRNEFDIFCVDTFLGSQEHWLNDIYLAKLSFAQGRPDFYQEFLKRAAVTNSRNLVPICLPSVTAATVLNKLGQFADLIYIDGAHEYQDVLSDLVSYFPLLRKNGIMFGDDYHYTPLQKAVQKFAEHKQLHLYVHMNKKWILLDPTMIDFLNKIKNVPNIFSRVSV